MTGVKNIIPVNTALYSFGMSGKVFHAPFLKVSPYYKVCAVWERTKNLSEAMFPHARIYRSAEDILNDPGVELVIINTPNQTHFEYARQALKAGKHVVVEKPFTITAREGETLRQLATKNNLVLSVYHNRRFDSDFRTVAKVLKSGKLGKIREAEFRFDRFRLQPGKKLHKELPGPGTGNLYDLGSHLMDQALTLFGWPQQLFADIDIFRPASKVDDYFEIILYYPGPRVRLHSSYLAADPLPATVVYGEKGSFIKRKGDRQETDLSDGLMPGETFWGKDAENGIMKTVRREKIVDTSISPESGNYGLFYDQLYHAVRNGKQPPVTADQAIGVITLIELAYKSSRLKKLIPVPQK